MLLIAGAGAVTLLLLVVSAIAKGKPKPGPDNCLGNPAASTVILLDRSETITRQTLAEMRARAMRYVLDSVQDNERVSVFTVTDSSAVALRPLVSLCRPARHGNRLIENVQMLEKRFRSGFEQPIDSALAQAPATGTESPIAQTITDISLSQYLRSKRNTLLVFSDMLENTKRFSMYRCTSPESVIQGFRASRIGAMERPRFTNTQVRLNIIPRLDQARPTLACRDKLWVWFFGDNPGSNAGLDVDYLPGGPTVPTVDARIN